MKRIFTLLSFSLFLVCSLEAQVYLRGDFNGFGTSDVMTLRGAAHSITKTGISGSNAFKVANSDYSNPNLGLGSGVTINTKQSWFAGGGNSTLTFTSANYYTVNRVNNDVAVLETTFNPVTIPTVTQSPSGASQGTNYPVTINVTTSGTPNAGEVVYVRWTTDNFSSSTNSTASGSGTSWSISIPAQTNGTTVKYYAFTAKSSPSFSTGDTDFFTLQLNNNSNSNYSYTTSSTLSVGMGSFSALMKNNTSVLDWSTASEKNAAHFDIQRSNDNSAWSNIGQLKAVNNAYGSDYQFVDAQPLSGTNYYRLQMVDVNGSTELSKIVAVNASTGNKSLKIYPNPAKDVLTVVTDANTEGVSIFDINGRLVLSVVDKNQRVNIQNLASGVYFVRMMDKTGFVGSPVRFVKQ